MATLLLYGALLSYAIARPTSPASDNSPNIDVASTPTYATASDDNPAFNTNYRSTVEIIWSCLTVVFASSWLCVHPNVTGHNMTMWQRLRERLMLFVLAIIAPEILAVFSYYQWRGSRKLYQKFKDRAEGLNISLHDEDPPKPLGGTDTLNAAVHSNTTHQADIPHAQANHASASPPEECSIPAVVMEPSTVPEPGHHSDPPIREGTGIWARCWKRMSCKWSTIKATVREILPYGRYRQTAKWSYTHAHFVQMGGVVFCDKDGSVGFKRPEEWTDEHLKKFFDMKLSGAAINDRSKAGVLAKTLVVTRVLWFLVQTIARAAQGLPIALLEVATLAFIGFNFAMYAFWWDKPVDVEHPLEVPGIPDRKRQAPKHAYVVVIFVLLGCLDAILIGVWIYSPKQKRYPRLYAFGKRSTEAHSSLFSQNEVVDTFIDFTFSGTITVISSSFGALHVIGWYLPSPSNVERTLWRVSCVVLVLYPFILFTTLTLLFVSFRYILNSENGDPPDEDDHSPNTSGLDGCVFAFFLFFAILCGISYVAARLTIIVLPFFEMRNLPPLVHRTVSWSRFLSPI